MKPFLCSLLLAALVGIGAIAQTKPAAEDPLKIVILYGDRSHGSGAHEFKAGAKLLEMCLEEQTAVPVEVETHHNWPADNLQLLDKADAIVFFNDGTKIVSKGWELSLIHI